jgi:hypothetical protein
MKTEIQKKMSLSYVRLIIQCYQQKPNAGEVVFKLEIKKP